MPLISCYECGAAISSAAISCPHCGAPMQTTSQLEQKRNTSCTINGVQHDLSAVDQYLMKTNSTGRKRYEMDGVFELSRCTNLDYDNRRRLWKIIDQHNAIPATYNALTPDQFASEKSYAKQNSAVIKPLQPKCPTCSSTNVVKQVIMSRGISGAIFGRLSVEGRAQWICKDCGYMW